MSRPDKILIEYLEYLDKLRKSGVVNMWGAVPYLMKEFSELDERDAGEIHKYWMLTFGNPSR